MTDHLPECPAPLCDWGDPSAKCMGYEDCHHLCCCAALRACEQRVREDERMQILATAGLSWDEAIAIMSPQDAVNILQQQHKEKP